MGMGGSMTASQRLVFVLSMFSAGTAVAQVPPPPPAPETPPPEDAEAPKEPKRGDFNAGGQVRLPNGPDEMGEYATFNWVAFDARGTYYLLKSVTITGNAPLAVKKPETLAGGAVDPRFFGGMSVTLDARLPKMDVPMVPSKDTVVGLILTGAYMREGAMLLSEKDFPLFVGDFKPGLAGGVLAKAKVSSLIDFSLTPTFVYQQGTMESINAVQIPTSTIVKLGETLKVSADLGIFTGDDFKFGGDSGGRIAAGAAIDLKIGKIITHAGVGFASLLTGGAYPTITDSLYIDLNVKYAK